MSFLGVALVTGASKGIGRAIALRLAADGFDVGINDVPTAREGLESLKAQIEEKGRRSTIAIGDVSMQDDVENIVSTVVKDLGRLDVMVANAGICRAHLITETKVDEWDKLFAVNARGVFLCYKYAALQMIKQGQGGRIIGASSLAGRRGEASLGAYSATKFAVRGLTQAAAAEWGRHGITVNSYCPGIIQTDIIQDIADGTKLPLEDIYAKFGHQTAVGYNGTVEDVANVVSFLASKDAHFITGQGVGVDGGMQYS
ncbi:Diacetyl reductase [(S)-acetoin forming] [Termitomyces sp. J132]|nr:Diacetyl reductase [(S)-acetoin forming] [Termitomyces sp. J132]